MIVTIFSEKVAYGQQRKPLDYVSNPDHIMLRLVKVKVKVRTLDTAPLHQTPRAGSGVVRIDPLYFLAGCRTR